MYWPSSSEPQVLIPGYCPASTNPQADKGNPTMGWIYNLDNVGAIDSNQSLPCQWALTSIDPQTVIPDCLTLEIDPQAVTPGHQPLGIDYQALWSLGIIPWENPPFGQG